MATQRQCSVLPRSSFHRVGFELSLINITSPYFCLQLFIRPYYENLILLCDCWLLPLEICGFWCIIEYSWSHKWLLLSKVWAFRIPDHLVEECSPPISQSSSFLHRDSGLSHIVVWLMHCMGKKRALQHCSWLSMVTLRAGLFLLVSESIAVGTIR